MLGFLVAVIAGLLTPQLDGPVTTPVTKFLGQHFEVDPAEKRAISFMIAVLAAAILAALLDSGTTFGVILGAILGYFGMRIYALLRRIIEARTDNE